MILPSGTFAHRALPTLTAVTLGILLSCWSPAGRVQAQDSIPAKNGVLTLDDCVALGLAEQPALTAAQASLDAAEANYTAGQNLKIIRLISRQARLRVEQSCHGVTIAQAGLLQAEWETRYAVTRNYFSMIFAREQEEVANSVLIKLRQNRENAKRMVEEGVPKITLIDVEQLDLQIAFLEARLAEATVGIERARAALREAIGLDRDSPLVISKDAQLPAPVYEIDRNRMITLGLERRGEMIQALEAEQLASLEVAAQRASRKLKVSTFAAGGDLHSRPIPQGVSNNEYRPGAIGLEMPPFMFGKRPDRIARAQAFDDRAGAVIDKTQKLITLEIDSSFLKWQESIEKIRRLDKTINLAKGLADKVTRRFNDKKATGEELIKARTLEDQAKSHYNEALYNHALALAALERVTAGGYRPTYAAKGKKP